MSIDDPRFASKWNTIDDSTIELASAIQLISHIHHNVRQPVAAATGWSELLATGIFGFTDVSQQEALVQLQASIMLIANALQGMNKWLAARIDTEGNWTSDAYGSYPHD